MVFIYELRIHPFLYYVWQVCVLSRHFLISKSLYDINTTFTSTFEDQRSSVWQLVTSEAADCNQQSTDTVTAKNWSLRLQDSWSQYGFQDKKIYIFIDQTVLFNIDVSWWRKAVGGHCLLSLQRCVSQTSNSISNWIWADLLDGTVAGLL